MYKKVELKNGFVGMEHEVAKKWKEKYLDNRFISPYKIITVEG